MTSIYFFFTKAETRRENEVDLTTPTKTLDVIFRLNPSRRQCLTAFPQGKENAWENEKKNSVDGWVGTGKIFAGTGKACVTFPMR